MYKIESKIILITIAVITAGALSAVTNFSLTYGQVTGAGTKLIHAGEGNASAVLIEFVPKNVEIKAGESVTWINPTSVPEPHSVTFLKDKKF